MKVSNLRIASILRRFLTIILCMSLVYQLLPSTFIVSAETKNNFGISVNGNSAEINNQLIVDYGQELSFTLNGHITDEEVTFFYATKDDAANAQWTPITNGRCQLEPGNYLLNYMVMSLPCLLLCQNGLAIS